MLEVEDWTARRPVTGESKDLEVPSLQDASQALSRLQQEALSWIPRVPEKIARVTEQATLIINDALKAAAEAAAPKKTEWTIAIDLTTNFYNGNGVTQRMGELEKLAAKTEGKPVTFVVQAARPIGGDALDPEFFSYDYDYQMERYVIQNGKIQKIETSYSRGYGGDLEDLLTFTCKRFKPEKLGLILDSHGGGNQGLQGDAFIDMYAPSGNIGELSVDGLVKSIKKGLKGSGREKIDLLNFDCCLMGQNGVVQRLQGLTDHIVASTETEHIIGQNISKPLTELLADPKVTPNQLAERMIEACKTQAPRESGSWLWKKPVPVETLSHYNLAHAKEFGDGLNKLGDALTLAIKDPNNAKVIEAIIDKTFTYGGKRRQISVFGLFFAPESHGTKTDIKDFTERVIKAIDAKELKDPDGTIKQAASEALKSHDKLVQSYFGYGLYDKRGGLTVFLPSRHLRDLDFAAQSKTTAFQLHKAGLEFREDAAEESFKNLAKKMKTTEDEIDSANKTRKIDIRTLEQVTQKFAKAKELFKALQESVGREEFMRNLQEFQSAAESLSKSNFYQMRLVEARDKAKTETSDVYKAELVTSDNGWGRFRRAMQKD